MPVYIIRAGETEFVKIGWAKSDPLKRCNDLQCAHWEELQIIRLVAGGLSLEGAFHRHFQGRRVRGEWFRFCPEMLTMLPSGARPLPVTRKNDGLQKLIRSIGKKQLWVAAQIDVPCDQFSQMARGTRMVPAHKVPLLAKALRVTQAHLRAITNGAN